MSTTLTIPYTTPANYTYDAAKVEITGGKAKLLLLEGDVDFTQTFASDVGFTYDAAKAEFTGGKVQQKDLRATDATCGATYTNDINLNWGNGTLTGTGTGSPTVSGGKLDLRGSTKFVQYSGTGNSDSMQVGCIRFMYTPNYSGATAGDKTLYSCSQSVVSLNNLIYLRHDSTAHLVLTIKNNAAADIIASVDIGWWNCVSGTEYEFELDYDLTSGATRLFKDGVQFGSTMVQTGTRSGTVGIFNIGAYYNGTNIVNGYFDKVKIFSTVQHTSNYTPGYTVSEYIYEASNVIMPEMEHTGAGTIKLFNSFIVVDANSPRYTIQIARSGNYLYWNGAAWVTSNNTYAQANSAATFNANAATLPADGEKYGQGRIFFTDSVSQAYVDNVTANMHVNIGYNTSDPTVVVNSTFSASEILTFLETATKPANTEVKYVLTIGGVDKWFSGSLLTSNGTYAQSNTRTELSTNILSFLSGREIVQLKVFLHTSDVNATPELDENTLTYNAAKPAPVFTAVNVPSIVEGFLYDANGALASQTVKIRPYTTGFILDEVIVPYIWETVATTDANGWFSASVFVQPATKFWEMKVGTERYKLTLADVTNNYLEDVIVEFLGVE